MTAITGSASQQVTSALSTATQGVNDNDPLFAGLKGDDLTRAKAQYALQKQQETVAFATNIMKKLNEIAMLIVNNLR